ncbi:ATP/GTP binding protein [Streptomyces himastatinicus ATCC 53653]|uniref:ATP/GTP binding protein n=1 Tax=Streptomyces himastatinicus ATCC 53653 TaxID=457427 RepID=D9WL78_9ACTN|nr:ATP/GTP binding protein [Streptomyces himastatinicus ATCC 53653]
MIVCLNGTRGAGKTTTGALVQLRIPDSRVFDAEKVCETLMDITSSTGRRGGRSWSRPPAAHWTTSAALW